MNKLAFNPATGLKNSSAFPNPVNETETRAQFQELHDQTRDYINDVVTLLGDTSTVIQLRISPSSTIQYRENDSDTWHSIAGVTVDTVFDPSSNNAIANSTVTNALGTQVTYSLSGTTLTITTK